MSDFLPPVIAVLGAEVSGFSTGIGKAISEMGKAETNFGKLSALGKAAFLGLGAAAVGIGVESVKLAANFDQAMEMIHTQAGATQAEVDALKNKVLQLAPQVGVGPEKLAESLYHVESAGFRAGEALDITTAAAKLATIGQSDLETTTQAVVGVMASQIKGVKDAADAGNLLNTTVGIGDMRMQQLALAIGTGLLPKAASVGLSFEDVGAALATLTDNVTPANEAATRLGMTFSLMAAPVPKAKAAYESIGMTSVQLANDLRSKGLVGALEDLKQHLDATYPPAKAVKLSLQEQQAELGKYSQSLAEAGVPLEQQKTLLADFKKQLDSSGSAAVKQSAAISAMFGGGKSSGTMLTLLEELPRVQDKMKAYGDSTSRAKQADDAWKSEQKLFAQQLRQLGAELQATGVKIGEFLIPKIQAAADWMSKHKEIVKVVAAAIGGVLVVAIGAYTVAMIQAAIATIAATWEILLIIAAIALVAVGIYELVKHWKTVWGFIKRIAADVWHWLVDAWNDTWNAVKGALTSAGHWIAGAAKGIWHSLVDAWNDTWNAIKSVGSWIKSNIIDPVVNFFENYLIKPITAVISAYVSFWRGVWDVVKTIVQFAWGFISVIFDDVKRVIIAVLTPVINAFKETWNTVWGAIKQGFDLWWSGVKTVFGWIDQYGIKPVEAGLHWLHQRWDEIWGAIKKKFDEWWGATKKVFDDIYNTGVKGLESALSWLHKRWDEIWSGIKKLFDEWWGGVKVVFGYVKRDGIDPIHDAIKWLGDEWDKIWGGIKGGLDAAWKFMRPIFDSIKEALHDIKAGWDVISKDPAGAGKALAHFMHFADGGWVPGTPGQPQLAVVHGGEFVLSRDMLASMRGSGPTVSGTVPLPGMASSLGAQTITVQNNLTLMVDGKQLHAALIPAAQQYKQRTGTTGLS